MICHGAYSVLVSLIISSEASRYSSHFSLFLQSSFVIFHCFSTFSSLSSKRSSCSSLSNDRKNLRMTAPELQSDFSKSLISSYAWVHSFWLANPSTLSTSTLPYQLRSKKPICPLRGISVAKRHK